MTTDQTNKLTELYNKFIAGTNSSKGSVSLTVNSAQTITLGYKPKAVVLWCEQNPNAYFHCAVLFNSEISTTKFITITFNHSPCTGTYRETTLGTGNDIFGTLNITSTGFTVTLVNGTYKTFGYIASA